MTFVKVAGNPTRQETEELTKVWQSSLWNNHIPAERLAIFYITKNSYQCVFKTVINYNFF